MKVDWQKLGGLLPAIVQDAGDDAVLMLAYMNEEALSLTLRTGYAHYFSRSKGRIWKKGEESGHVQLVREAFLDCDNDALLLKVEQCGGSACHTGARSCFFQRDFAAKMQRKYPEPERLRRDKFCRARLCNLSRAEKFREFPRRAKFCFLRRLGGLHASKFYCP